MHAPEMSLPSESSSSRKGSCWQLAEHDLLVFERALGPSGPFRMLVSRIALCTQRQCSCRDVTLSAIGLESGTSLAHAPLPLESLRLMLDSPQAMQARIDIDLGVIEADSGQGRPPLGREWVEWLQPRLDGELLDMLHERWLRAKGWRQRTPEEVEWPTREAGQLFGWHETHPDERRDLFLYDGIVFMADDLYCVNPACLCHEAVIAFAELFERDRASSIGYIRVSLPDLQVIEWQPSRQKQAILERLWAAFQQRHPHAAERLGTRKQRLSELGQAHLGGAHPGRSSTPVLPRWGGTPRAPAARASNTSGAARGGPRRPMGGEVPSPTEKDAMRHKNTSARRAKKKHQKALKREQQLAHRRQELARHVVKAAAHLHSPLSHWNAQADGLEGLARKGKMTPFEAANWGDELASRGEHIPKEVWTTGRVKALSAEELIARLAGLGISTTEDSFREQFAQAWSIWETAERLWLPHLQPQATVHERDFVRVAACVLHGRWMPDAPSHEALLSAYFEGLAALENSEDRQAVERWLSFWRMLKPRLPTRIRHDDLISELRDMREPFFSWALDFATAARNAVREQPELAAPSAEVLGELLSRLAPEDEHWELSLIGDRACLLEAAGRRDEAEQLLRQLREQYPHQAVGYAIQADLWSHKEANPEQLQRALQLLEEAVARPVLDGQHWDLDSRVQQLRLALTVRTRSPD